MPDSANDRFLTRSNWTLLQLISLLLIIFLKGQTYLTSHPLNWVSLVGWVCRAWSTEEVTESWEALHRVACRSLLATNNTKLANKQPLVCQSGNTAWHVVHTVLNSKVAALLKRLLWLVLYSSWTTAPGQLSSHSWENAEQARRQDERQVQAPIINRGLHMLISIQNRQG